MARIVDVTPDQYHKLPGFSASVAKVVIGHSEEHALAEYESREEAQDDEEDQQKLAKLERGTVLHALVLGKGQRIKVLDYDKYTTAKARAERDEARAAGFVPVKRAKFEVYERTAIGLRAKLAAAGHRLEGQSEVAIEWTESTPHGDVACKGMLDHLEVWGDLDGTGPVEATISDLKIVDDAAPARCMRTAETMLYGIQAAAYRRGIAAVFPRLAGRVSFRFLWCEPARPYGLWDPEPDGGFAELGERRWLRAVAAWARGRATGEWPGYHTERPSRRRYIEAPLYALREEGVAYDG